MKKRNGLYYLTFLILVLCACTQNELEPDGKTSEYDEIPFEFNFSTSPMEVFGKLDMNTDAETRAESPSNKKGKKKEVKKDALDDSCIDVTIGGDNKAETRAVDPTDAEKKITEICIFQFNGVAETSTLLHKEYVGNASTTINASLAASGATNAVYIVANVGDITGKFTSATKVSDFKAALCDVTVNSSKGLPMLGRSDIDMTTATAVNVSLNFMVAKLMFTCTNSMPSSVGTFNFSSVQLRNVGTQTPMNAATTAPATVTDLGANTSYASGTELTWYVPENMSGTVAGMTTYKRGNYTSISTPAIKVPGKAMYIEIKGNYKPNGAAAGDEASAVTYQVYLGSNNTTNFDVARNKQYKITAAIKGINLTDNRVIIGEDLSAAGTQTANCYIALKKNYWYRFDGTKQGNNKTVAFTAGKDVSGKDVTPRVMTPTEAFVIWQTTGVEGQGGDVVQNAYWTDRGYVVFRTGSDVEGNAVIGVREAATEADAVAWSWHIWKTANDPRNQKVEFAVRDNMTGKFAASWTAKKETSMTRNLGAANNTPKDKLAGGLLYQWGRKDPFIGSSDYANTSEAVRNTPYPTVVHRDAFKWKDGSTHGSATAAVKPDTELGGLTPEEYAKKHPTHFIVQHATSGGETTYDWYAPTRAKQNDNLWGNPNYDDAPSASQLANSKRGTKTIYDPCPHGWRVAPQNTWTSFTKSIVGTGSAATPQFPGGNNYGTGQYLAWNVVGNTGSASLTDVQKQFTNNVGWTFYCQGDLTGTTVYFPASGQRSWTTGELGNVSTNGRCWKSSSNGLGELSNRGSDLNSNASNVNPLNTGYRAEGFPVRCVQELT